MKKDEKCELMRRYRNIICEVENRQREIEWWRSLAEKVTHTLAPVRYTVKDGSRIENAIEKIEQHRERLAATLSALVDQCEAIESAIDAVPDARERMLLRYRYIDGMTFESIADKMGISTRWVYEIHDSAVKNILNSS